MISFNVKASIERLGEKIKTYKPYEPEIFLLVLVLTVGTLAFGLGRLSKIEDEKEPVKIEMPKDGISGTEIGEGGNLSAEKLAPGAGLLVASRNGLKYHFPWCPGALQISELNKIWFQSREEAEGAGYQPAANCKGL